MVEPDHSYQAYLALYDATLRAEAALKPNTVIARSPWQMKAWYDRPKEDRVYIRSLQIASAQAVGLNPEKILAPYQGDLDAPDSGVVAW